MQTARDQQEGPAAPPAPSPSPSPLVEEDPEALWLRTVYRGDQAPQLTLRAALMGAAIGAVMALSNLYVGLRAGIAAAVAVTACLVSYSVHQTLVRLFPKRFGPPMSILESNAMQTTASAAGYATGSTLATASAAFLRFTGHHVPGWTLFLWTLLLAALGAFFALPLKRQVINREALPFPTGTAAAVMLRSLHEREPGKPHAGARALGLAGVFAGLLAVARDGLGWIPASLPIPGRWRGAALGELSVAADVSVLMVGIGTLIGLRTALSMLLGAALCYGALVPALHAQGTIAALGFENTLQWSLWPGAGLLVGASLMHLALQGRVLAGAVRALGGQARRAATERTGKGEDVLASVEVPRRWFWFGIGALSVATAALARIAFGIPVGYGLLAVAMAFVLSLVACRVTGVTDATPTGALGQVTQVTYGALMPQNVVANLMTSSITGNTAAAASDLLSDLKSGFLLGARPRQQFLAQLLGCVVGSAVAVPFFYVLVPDAAAVGSERFPAPGAQMTLSVAELLSHGLGALDPGLRTAFLFAAALGALLAVAEKLPPRVARWVPSSMGLGLALLLPASMTLSVAVGAAGAALLRWRRGADAEDLSVPIGSGLLAGESVVSVAIALMMALGATG